MHIVHFCTRTLCWLAAILFLGAGTARASYLIVVQQSGSNVTATGTGSIDTTDLTQSVTGQTAGSSTTPNAAFIVVGPTTTTQFTEWTGFTGPASFGTGGTSGTANSGSGQYVGITGKNGILELPIGYISASNLGTSTDTWTNKSLASMGLTPGTYSYPFGTAPHADSFTVQINTVPEPASVGVLALAAMGMRRRRRA